MNVLKNRKQQKGFLTVEFAFAMMMSVALSVLFFVLAFSLSSAFVAQYIAFSVGRIYSGGHVSVTEQEALARKKFTKIMSTPALGKLFSKDWFTLAYDARPFRSGVDGEVFEEYDSNSEGTRLISTGVRLVYTTKLFNLNLGPLGSTNPQDETFSAKITGFMVRNPTTEECQKFMSVGNRHRALLDIDDRFKILDRAQGSNTKYLPMEDNGC